MKRFSLFAALLVILTVIGFFTINKNREEKGSVSLIKSWGKMPIYFIENQGQVDPRVSYYIKGGEKTLFFGSEGITVLIHKVEEVKRERGSIPVREAEAGIKRWNVKLLFEGAREVNPKGSEKTGAKISYFKGPEKDWKTGIPTYQKVTYRELWPGVDVVYSGSMDKMEQDFVVKPGADPNQIRLAYLGAESVTIGEDGSMGIKTPFGEFREERPVAYQVIDGKKVPVDVSCDLKKEGDRYEYGFQLGEYDRTKELIIDPPVFIYAGFLGGASSEEGWGIAVDSSGNAFVTGWTVSGFPVTVGPDLGSNGGRDAFVAKVKADGTSLVYAGYIGGDQQDQGRGIAVDSSGNAYVTGEAVSTEATFPVKGGPDLVYNGGTSDAFVAKVKPDGTDLVYSGYIGGDQEDEGFSIAVDGSGNAYVTGQALSTEATFPVKGGPDFVYNGGTSDAFVAKVKPDGTDLVYCGYIGGDQYDYGLGIAVDGSGSAYVTGVTVSAENTFPETVGPDLTQNGGYDAFVAKVKSDGTGLTYAGYIGGSKQDEGYGIAVDGSGNAYVTGQTASTEATFPVAVGPDLTVNGGADAFVAKVKSDGTGLTYAGYIGGIEIDVGYDIAVDGSGNVYVTGYTASTEATFPVKNGPDLTQNGNLDAFVARVKADGAGLTYAGYIGGDQKDQCLGIAIDGGGNAYVTGLTRSAEATFPTKVGPDLTYK